MSFRSELKASKEIFAPAFRPMMLGAILFQSGNILETISDISFKRGSFPEPFDFPSHIGNFREAAMGTVGAYAMVGIFTMFPALIDSSRELFKRRAKQTAVAAFAISSAIQVAGEKFELTNSVFTPNTGDVLDAAYGVGWSAVIAVGAYQLVTGTEQAHHDRMQEAQLADLNFEAEPPFDGES